MANADPRPQPETRAGMSAVEPCVETGRIHASSKVVVDAASTELSTPTKTMAKPTTAILIVASHTLPESGVARQTRTAHAPASAA